MGQSFLKIGCISSEFCQIVILGLCTIIIVNFQENYVRLRPQKNSPCTKTYWYWIKDNKKYIIIIIVMLWGPKNGSESYNSRFIAVSRCFPVYSKCHYLFNMYSIYIMSVLFCSLPGIHLCY